MLYVANVLRTLGITWFWTVSLAVNLIGLCYFISAIVGEYSFGDILLAFIVWMVGWQISGIPGWILFAISYTIRKTYYELHPQQ